MLKAHAQLMMTEKTLSLWRGFPKSGSVKVWVGEDDSLRNALNLYHPYSSRGHFLANLIRFTPEGLTRRLLTEIRPTTATEELAALSNIIRSKFEEKRVAISFGAGTPGPHHKLTAQVSHEGRVVSYVKVGQGKAVSKLLRAEAKMLTWLPEQNFQAAAFPAVLALEQSQDRTLLFLSAPAEPGKRSPLNVSSVEANFLCALNALNRRVASVATALDMLNFPPFLVHLQSIDPNAAGALRDAAETAGKIFENVGVQVTCCHGDYAPWNSLTLTNNQLYVFDWEYGAREAPLFMDLFHRIFMPARLVHKRKAKEVIQQLVNLPSHPLLGHLILQSHVNPRELLGYALLYLSNLATRETSSETGPSSYLLQCLHHVLAEAGHPAHRKKVLVAAYACEPNTGSEPGVGWNMCQAISRAHDTWVVTRANNRYEIEKALSQAPNENLHFAYVDLPRWARFWKRGGRGIRTYYYVWQFAAWRAAKRLQHTIQFDIAHHVTFVNDWLFTFIAFLPIPYVWGPIGSHPKTPSGLTQSFGSFLADRLRYSFQAFMRVIDPLFWISAVRSRLIVGIDQSVGNRFPLSFLSAGKFVSYPAIGVERTFKQPAVCKQTKDPSRILSMGRLVSIKAFHLTIRAFAIVAMAHQEARLVIVGKGAEKNSLEQLAHTLKIRDRITFIDWLPRTEALEEMQKSGMFLFPSFEGGGMVVLEAMAHGLPVICLKYGGPGEMVTDDCGRLIQVQRHSETVRGLAAAINQLLSNHEMHSQLSTNARTRIAQCYLWENRHHVIEQWYESCGLQRKPHTLTEAPIYLQPENKVHPT